MHDTELVGVPDGLAPADSDAVGVDAPLGVALLDGVGEPLAVPLLLTVDDGETDPVGVGESEPEELAAGDAAPVCVPLALTVDVALDVMDSDREGLLLGVLDAVDPSVAVVDGIAVLVGETLAVAVEDGDAGGVPLAVAVEVGDTETSGVGEPDAVALGESEGVFAGAHRRR